MSMIGILALQGDFQAHHDALSKLDASTRFVRTASDLTGLDAMVLPGGESSTFLKLLESEGLWEPLARFAKTHPILGTCAGAILMADQVENPSQPCFGLIRMTVRRNAYGRQLSSSIRHAEAARDLNVGRKPGPPLEAVLIRAPIITEVGPEVQVLATLDGRPVVVRQGNYLAATFHPELTSDSRIHRYFNRMISKDESKDPAGNGK
ncbi:MAG: pyridoxal 5'-phosphate synthase glutaminase subunit PdxT [Acidobacteria bacterium]|nr:pyridoxal 5'-phosphate synthase glutaminase subunit PdxT [Acidobacteriota bacterium]